MLFLNRCACVGMALLILCACGGEKEPPLQGTWRMKSGIYTDVNEQSEIKTDDSERFCLKIMSANHFAVVEMFQDNPDSLFFAAVGTYDMTNGTYIERYEASNVGYQVGNMREFNYTLEGEVWTISTSEEGMELKETWIKVPRR